MGAAAATAGAAALLEMTKGSVAAADGDPIKQGQIANATNTEQTSTELRYGGVSPLRGVMLLSNDSGFNASAAAYPATLGGWAGGGKAGVPNGIYGYTSVAGGNAIVGSDAGTAATGKGILGASKTGTGVYGISYSAAPSATAVAGVIASATPGASSAAVRGQNNGTGANGIGVAGSHAGSGMGVYGYSPSGGGVAGYSVNGGGVFGSSTSGNAVSAVTNTGVGVHSSSGGTAVYGISYTTGPGTAAIYGLIEPTTPDVATYAVVGEHSGTGVSGIAVWGSQAGSGVGVYGSVRGPGGYGVYGYAPTKGVAVFANGNFRATGSKGAVVPAEDGFHRTLYCVESPECWFEDFGSALLVEGSARVQIDPTFASTVRTDEYHIFLTPQGDSKGLYVGHIDAAGFTVREQQAGRSSLPFSYRVVARRRDVLAPRLEKVMLDSAVLSPPTPARIPAAAAPPAPAQPAPPLVPTEPQGMQQ
jgi:hypothetical protein